MLNFYIGRLRLKAVSNTKMCRIQISHLKYRNGGPADQFANRRSQLNLWVFPCVLKLTVLPDAFLNSSIGIGGGALSVEFAIPEFRCYCVQPFQVVIAIIPQQIQTKEAL